MTRQTALVTGIGGFAGGVLAEDLVGQGVRVVGTTRKRKPAQPGAEPLRQVELIEVDLADADRVAAVIEQVRPDLIFHLAAQSLPSQSWADPAGTLVNNVLLQLWVLQGVLQAELHPRILVTCSNEEY